MSSSLSIAASFLSIWLFTATSSSLRVAMSSSSLASSAWAARSSVSWDCRACSLERYLRASSDLGGVVVKGEW